MNKRIYRGYMDTETVLRIAKDVGIECLMDKDDEFYMGVQLTKFASAIEKQVREELAAICEAHGNERWILRPMSINDDPWKVGVLDCVELLRGDYKL